MDLRETQEALETQWLEAGISKYKHTYDVAPFSSTDVGSYITGKAMAALETWVASFTKSHTFKSSVIKGVFLCLTPLEISTITLRLLMDTAFNMQKAADASSCISSVSIKLGDYLLHHLNYTVLRKKNSRAYDHMMDFLKDKPKRYYHRTIKWYKDIQGIAEIKGTTEEKAAIGNPMLRGAIETTGLFEVLPKFIGKRQMHILYPSHLVMSNVINSIDRLSMMHPICLPMVIPPVPWTSNVEGGYLVLRSQVITHQEDTGKLLFEKGELGSRLEVLNKLGAVPWEINKDILRHLGTAYDSSHSSVPQSDLGHSLPVKPWASYAEYKSLEVNRPDILASWRQTSAIAYVKFFHNRVIGQRLSFLRMLSIARRFEPFETIWFPYRLDYRGRCYSVATTLNPQGNDIARSLLRFHKRTPLSPTDAPAWRWYLIHGSNLMGVDKVPFDERVSFTRQHHEDIVRSARDPFGHQWWTQADKPWCMLAWCTEYERITSGQQSYTQIPVSRDGRCNGLQHLSTTVRDRDTAELVSLVPLDRPSDIYTKVLQAVEQVIPDDSYWKGKVTRKLVKRNTMTTPYNVTINGMGNQIKEEILVASVNNQLSKDDKIHAVELREYNHSCIMGLLGKTADLMQWYNTVAHLYMKAGLEISWVLPDGFRVLQTIPKCKTKQVQLEKRKVLINYRVKLKQQDARRNTSAFSPNVTHSMDATHLALVVAKLPLDTPFVAIHDSYGMTAPDIVNLGEDLIVSTFADLYESFDVLEAIQKDYLLKTGKELPAPPERGVLSTHEIRGATYAFA